MHNLQRISLVAGKTPVEAVTVEYHHPQFGKTLGHYRCRDLIYDIGHDYLRLHKNEPAPPASAASSSSSSVASTRRDLETAFRMEGFKVDSKFRHSNVYYGHESHARQNSFCFSITKGQIAVRSQE